MATTHPTRSSAAPRRGGRAALPAALLASLALLAGCAAGGADAPSTTAAASASASSAGTSSRAVAPSGSAAPTGSATGESTAAPASSSSTARATDAAAEAFLEGPAAPWDEITAAPVHIAVHHGEEMLVSAEISPTQTDEKGDIDPEPKSVGWYGPPQWGTTPGETSQHPGILAGHVVYYRVKDVFWRLQEMKAGDVVVLTYDDGAQAVFRADADAVSIEKEALTQDPENAWAWTLERPDAKVTLITCDLAPGTGLAGNAYNNFVVQATRVA